MPGQHTAPVPQSAFERQTISSPALEQDARVSQRLPRLSPGTRVPLEGPWPPLPELELLRRPAQQTLGEGQSAGSSH